MEKIAVGPEAKGAIDLNHSPTRNLQEIAKAKKCSVSELTAIILDRPRHKELIKEVRMAGARIWLIGDGDVSAAIATSQVGSGVDVLFGTGGAPEGVIAAAALRCRGGDFVGKLIYKDDEEKARAKKMGISDLTKMYGIHDLAKGNVMFCATGITQGTFLNGIRLFHGGAHSHSIVMRSETGTVRYIQTEHHFVDGKPRY
jgi:fructose-1,6-bisphosphatase/sedoheptulose 1,7-bisphosphatase-like protein